MTVLSWIAVVVLGLGSSAVFVWFLRDVRRIMSSDGDDRDDPAV